MRLDVRSVPESDGLSFGQRVLVSFTEDGSSLLVASPGGHLSRTPVDYAPGKDLAPATLGATSEPVSLFNVPGLENEIDFAAYALATKSHLLLAGTDHARVMLYRLLQPTGASPNMVFLTTLDRFSLPVSALSVSACARLLASSSEGGELRLVATETGLDSGAASVSLALTHHKRVVRGLAFGPTVAGTSRMLVSSSPEDGDLAVWALPVTGSTASTLAPEASIRIFQPVGHFNFSGQVAWHVSGSWFAVPGRKNGITIVCRAPADAGRAWAAAVHVEDMYLAGESYAVAMSPDGRFLAATSQDGRVVIFAVGGQGSGASGPRAGDDDMAFITGTLSPDVTSTVNGEALFTPVARFTLFGRERSTMAASGSLTAFHMESLTWHPAGANLLVASANSGHFCMVQDPVPTDQWARAATANVDASHLLTLRGAADLVRVLGQTTQDPLARLQLGANSTASAAAAAGADAGYEDFDFDGVDDLDIPAPNFDNLHTSFLESGTVATPPTVATVKRPAAEVASASLPAVPGPLAKRPRPAGSSLVDDAATERERPGSGTAAGPRPRLVDPDFPEEEGLNVFDKHWRPSGLDFEDEDEEEEDDDLESESASGPGAGILDIDDGVPGEDITLAGRRRAAGRGFDFHSAGRPVADSPGSLDTGLSPTCAGSTPWILNRRILAWNHVGMVLVHMVPPSRDAAPGEPQQHFYETRMHDAGSRSRRVQIQTATDYTMAAINEHGVVLAGPGGGSASGRSTLQFSSLDARSESVSWTLSLDAGEHIEAVALGDGWVAAITSLGFIRLYTTGRLPMPVASLPVPGSFRPSVYSKPGRQLDSVPAISHTPVAAAAGMGDRLVVTWRAAGQVQPCWAQFVVTPGSGLAADGTPGQALPLTPGSSLRWVGLTPEKRMATFDSQGILRILIGEPGAAIWTPVLDMVAAGRAAAGAASVWPVAVEDGQLVFLPLDGGNSGFCAVRGLRYPLAEPSMRPLPQSSKFACPIRSSQASGPDAPGPTSIATIEQEWATVVLRLLAAPDVRSAERSELLVQHDLLLVRLLSDAIRQEHDFRAIELARLMKASSSLDFCIAAAKKSGRRELLNTLVAIQEEIRTRALSAVATSQSGSSSSSNSSGGGDNATGLVTSTTARGAAITTPSAPGPASPLPPVVGRPHILPEATGATGLVADCALATASSAAPMPGAPQSPVPLPTPVHRAFSTGAAPVSSSSSAASFLAGAGQSPGPGSPRTAASSSASALRSSLFDRFARK
ncbi:hypothetical protein H696_03550 [Fonticula alba]|uniref:Uncharacterized protein n=1 Tax=Fonticula alba TaxID=691883 RepID=A0A058Z853_FONAL|nr:hypothetical protein H696_03550 [Fonticula alba]KCV70088.1 hypothetical protein H696_03550 [Fonticula alba]|eukprot:XP_009495694.1 hypothetical protein H696_03550 [Fonticula alba]